MRNLLVVCLPIILMFASAASTAEIAFKKTHLDSEFRAEGVAVGDFNGDGRLDIAAGSVYYAAPDWKMVAVWEEPKVFPVKGYSPIFGFFAEDLNGDGRTDMIQNDFPGKQTWWYENPGSESGAWTRRMVVPVTNNESPLFADLMGDGRRELICGYSPDASKPDGPEKCMIFAAAADDPNEPWNIHVISKPGAPGTRKYAHGLGVGDLNGDGRSDVVTTKGWWEAPKNRRAGIWAFHEAPLGEDAAHMIVDDFDGDGDNDVLSTSAHRYGVWWHEQTSDGWTTREIDNTISQTHAVIAADINGDGLTDFVTGKRWYAHNGRDPGAEEPALLVWYELRRAGGRPLWIRHTIDDDSGVGTQFEVTDLNGDGLLDVVTSNKKGVFCFEQVRK